MKNSHRKVITFIILIIIALVAVSCGGDGEEEPAPAEEPADTSVTEGAVSNQGETGETSARQDDTATTTNSGTEDENPPPSTDDPPQDGGNAAPETGTITITGAEGTFVVLDTEDGSYTTVTAEGGTAVATVPAGVYHIFSYGENYEYTAAWADGGGLAPITVSTGQAVDVAVSVPAYYCEATYQLPGTADGQYASTNSDEYASYHQCNVAAVEGSGASSGTDTVVTAPTGGGSVGSGGMVEVPLPPAGRPDLMGCTQPNQPQPTGSWYLVQPCDNLFRIGLAYGVSWTTIAYYNGLYNADYIVPGMWLYIPWQPY